MGLKKIIISLICVFLVPAIGICETIDVQIKGIDDGVKTTKQKDYKEAVLFAKREAIERAGVKIKSITTVSDLMINSDYIESQAEAVLLPGYNIMDVGYQNDGTYLIILIGKVKTSGDIIENKQLRYAKSLIERGEKQKAEEIIKAIIDESKDDNTVQEALYYNIIWGLSKTPEEDFERFKAYYPDSKYLGRTRKHILSQKAKVRFIIDTTYGQDGERQSWEKNYISADLTEHKLKLTIDPKIEFKNGKFYGYDYTIYIYIDDQLIAQKTGDTVPGIEFKTPEQYGDIFFIRFYNNGRRVNVIVQKT